MELSKLFICLSAFLLVVTGCVHSILGERKLLMPLLKGREGVLKSGLARTVLRFAWHLTTASWVVIAVIMLSIVIRPEALVKSILISTGLLFSIAGMYSAFATKLRHAGWPFLTAGGVCALLAAALLRST